MSVDVFCDKVNLWHFFPSDRQTDANTNITAHSHKNTRGLIDGLFGFWVSLDGFPSASGFSVRTQWSSKDGDTTIITC